MPSLTYTYDDADRLTSVDPPAASAVSYTWDDNGNLTNRGSDSFAWDYEDRLTSATVNSTTTTFAYRGDGLRNSRTTGGNTTTFTWDIAAGLPVVIDDGNQYVYGAGLEAMKQSGNWYYYLADGLGSTMAIVDSSGTVQKSYTYDVYGKPTATGTISNEFDFAGQQTDPTGLQYLRARYMDPETGVFISREPLALVPGWLGHPFSYASTDPVGRLDATGLKDVDSDDGTTPTSSWSCGDACWYWTDPARFGLEAVVGNWLEQLWFEGMFRDSFHLCSLVNEKKVCTSSFSSADLRRLRDQLERDAAIQDMEDLATRLLFILLGIHKPGRISDRRAACIQEKYGINIHTLKEGLGAGYDLFVEKTGDIVVKPKSGSGPGDPTGYNMDQFSKC